MRVLYPAAKRLGGSSVVDLHQRRQAFADRDSLRCTPALQQEYGVVPMEFVHDQKALHKEGLGDAEQNHLLSKYPSSRLQGLPSPLLPGNPNIVLGTRDEKGVFVRGRHVHPVLAPQD